MTTWIVTSSVLIVVVLALRFVLRGKISRRLQYGLWALAPLRLLIPWTLPKSNVSVMYVAEGVREYLFTQTEPMPVETGDSGTAAPQKSATTGLSGGVRGVKLHDVWILGMFLVGVCLLSANLVFAARLRKKRVPFDVPGSQLPVYVVEGIPSPCLMGIIEPAIYLTPQAAAMEEGLDAVLAHERTHNSHCDEIWAILRGICLAIHWYNPLVWLAVILSRRDGELACDEGTTEDMTEEERLNYGRTLIHLAVAQPRLDSLFYIATTMTGSAKELEERVRSIADRFRTTTQTKALVAVVMVLAVMVTFTAASTTAGEMPVVQRRGVATLQMLTLNERERVISHMSGVGDMAIVEVRDSDALKNFVLSAEEWVNGVRTRSFDLVSRLEMENEDFSEGDTRYYLSSNILKNEDGFSCGVEWNLITVSDAVTTYNSPWQFSFEPQDTKMGVWGAYGQYRPTTVRAGESYVLAIRGMDWSDRGIGPGVTCENLSQDKSIFGQVDYVTTVRLTAYETEAEARRAIRDLYANE